MKDVSASQKQAYAPGTFDNLTYQWVRYLHFCSYFEKVPLLATPEVITAYAQHVANSVKSYDTVINYLSGVKTLHKILQKDFRTFSSFSLRLALQGIKRTRHHVVKQAEPITPKILMKMHDKLDFDQELDRVFWACSLVAFFLLFRKSNLVPVKKSGFDIGKGNGMARHKIHTRRSSGFGMMV